MCHRVPLARGAAASALAALALLVSVPVLAQQKDRPKELPEKEALEKATADGKYSDLLKKIKVPEDRDHYADFSDDGYWDGTEWAGHKNLPAGHWVYDYPHWYIWGNGEKATLKKASADGKYSKLLKKIKVPEDRDEYKDFYEWGHWTGTEWKGHKNLPAGYWVYTYPYWYIWRDGQK